MIVNADVFVKDMPGQLVGSLEPISLVNGNIVGVVHNRDNKISGRIGVNITFEVGSAEDLERLKEIWEKRDVMISRMSSVTETFPTDCLLIGDISPSQIDKLMAKAAKAIDMRSVDIRYSSKTGEEKSAAMVSVSVRSKEDVLKFNAFMMSACKRSNITYIGSVR
ncbi:MAG: hypothetical protein FWD81_03460 [Methanomassiliicoccaceae archaeon]|nr:hypothetical protein [Methanomassiliicoccaceae archaeon]